MDPSQAGEMRSGTEEGAQCWLPVGCRAGLTLEGLRNAVNTYRADTGEDERLSHVDVGVLWVHVLSCQIVQA